MLYGYWYYINYLTPFISDNDGNVYDDSSHAEVEVCGALRGKYSLYNHFQRSCKLCRKISPSISCINISIKLLAFIFKSNQLRDLLTIFCTSGFTKHESISFLVKNSNKVTFYQCLRNQVQYAWTLLQNTIVFIFIYLFFWCVISVVLILRWS